ncbi:hypothetical protein N6H18_13450 [Reichenbachiella agarivorans]|uniref:Uncharacterized protein n=1 Tax=Reichenbachiella agarivorans TaxID=2979464 RepID=A0ABY6CLF8_9BACT|nr:hypothetical protein [Reichenbachiella agarivorans]UXP31355.1 hypothetical protein N6H18_13450 [Reichenbachiella agarivorans]
MKVKILCLATFLFAGITCYAQYKDNGINLASICTPPNCIYSALRNSVEHPFDSTPQWTMNHVEFAFKNTGNYLVTGDLAIIGEELGAVINIEIDFFDESDQLVTSVNTGKFEFYAELGNAEPVVISGEITDELAAKVSFVNMKVLSSKLVPYYEITSDCYNPCKENLLNESIKEFKKSK